MLRKQCAVLVTVLAFALLIGSVGYASEGFDWRRFEGTTITVMTRRDTPAAALDEVIKEEFERDTGIKIDQVYMGREGWHERIAAIMTSGNPEPDLTIIHDPDAAALAAGGHAQALNPFLEDPSLIPPEFDLSAIPQGVIDSFSLRGNLYSLPVVSAPYMLFYRKDLLKEEGIEPPQTWDDFYEISRHFSQAHNPNSPTKYGHAVSGRGAQHTWFAWYTRAWARGADVLDVDNRKVILDSPEAIAAMEAMASEIEDGLVPPDFTSYTNVEEARGFALGLYPMTILPNASYFDAYPDNIDPQTQIGVTQVPGITQADGSVKRDTITTLMGFVMNPNSKNQEAAWYLLAYWMARQDLWEEILKRTPVPYPAAYAGENLDTRVRFDAYALGDAQNFARTPGFVPEVHQANVILGREVAAALTGTKSAERAMLDAAQDIRRVTGWE